MRTGGQRGERNEGNRPFSDYAKEPNKAIFHVTLCHVVILLKFVPLNVVVCVLMLSGSAFGRYAITRSLGLGLGLILLRSILYTKYKLY
jgi:hypothetical protein